jgi:hypothetical protein
MTLRKVLSTKWRCATLGLVALAAFLAAVPRAAFYAHHHAGDVAGHVHVQTVPVGLGLPGHMSGQPRSRPHSHRGGPLHVHTGEYASRQPLALLADVSSSGDRDHWHGQAPFQHAAPSLVVIAAPPARIELVAGPAALTPPASSQPTPRSRGPPLFLSRS